MNCRWSLSFLVAIMLCVSATATPVRLARLGSVLARPSPSKQGVRQRFLLMPCTA